MKIQIIARKRADVQTLAVNPFAVRVQARPPRILDFDIENRPLSYKGMDFTTAEVTAIAWAWVDQPENVTCFLLGEHDLPSILKSFVDAYNQADLVIGHYIKGHDLPMVNGALMEQGMPTLQDKRVCDTKVDLVTSKGLSLSQESLAAMFRLEHAKVSMNQAMWRAANRLTPEGLAAVRTRATGDVQQHMELWKTLSALAYLKPARVWSAGTATTFAYTP